MNVLQNGLTFQRAYYRERAYFSVFTVCILYLGFIDLNQTVDPYIVFCCIVGCGLWPNLFETRSVFSSAKSSLIISCIDRLLFPPRSILAKSFKVKEHFELEIWIQFHGIICMIVPGF